MTIRSRITVWYGGMLLASLLLMGAVLHYELIGEYERGAAPETPQEKIVDLLLFYGAPTVIVLMLGGSWLIHRMLRPIEALAAAAERVNAGNLIERIPLTGRGDELDRLARVFNEMLARIEAGVASVREFTLHASHELKTPLAILAVQAEDALVENTLSPEHRDLLQSQLEEARRLSALVDALGLLAKADAGLPLVSRASVHMDELLSRAVEDARILAEKNNIALKLVRCDPSTFDGDSAGLRQALLNLLENAVKHNLPGGWIRVEFLADPEAFTLSIENTGLPIPPELIPRVFDRFVRGPGVSEGSGLGLCVAKTILEAHEGALSCESRSEGGMRFVARFPRSFARMQGRESERPGMYSE